MGKKPSYTELEQKVRAYDALEQKLKDTQRHLEESERRFQAFFDHAPVGIAILNDQTRCIYFNSNFHKMTGSASDNPIGQKIDAFLPEAAPVIKPILNRILSTEKPVTNIEISGKPGSDPNKTPHFLTSFFPVTLPGSSTIYIGCVAIDISERHAAEKSLEENEKKMRSIFRAAPIGIGMISNRIFIEVNDLFCLMTGYSEKEIIGQDSRMLYGSDEEYEFIGQIYKKLEKKGIGSVETRLRRKNGQMIDVLLNYARLDRNSDSVQMSFTTLDITQKKSAEKKTKEAQRKLSTLVANLPGMVYRCKNDPDWTMEYVSSGCFSLTGYSESELMANRSVAFGEIIHTNDRGMVWEKIQKALNNKQSYKIIYRIQTKDQSQKWVWEQGEGIFDRSDQLMALEGFITDITDQKQLEEQTRQSTKLEAIGTLAGGIAHDFNNILFPIVGFAEMLKNDLKDDPVLLKKVDQILTASNRAKEMVKQILSFSRQSKTDIKYLQPHLIVREASKLIRASIPATIDIHLDIDSKTNPIMADPTEFHQIVMNLMTNAYQAMADKGGTMTVELKNNQVQNDHFVKLAVSDTGVGIPPEIESKIFDPYFTTKIDKKGTGLGLSTVHGLVKSMGGHIQVQTRPNQGTTLTISLPAQPSATNDVKKQVQKDSLGGNERILLVDDELAVLESIKETLQRCGFHVDMTVSSLDALEMVKNNREKFDLVLTDLTMPHMKGDELADKITTLCPDLPVIICTGYNYFGSREELNSKGIQTILQKPVTKKELIGTIREILDTHIPIKG